jgi:pimeloyl-ACP methyl ester carboxylesterase
VRFFTSLLSLVVLAATGYLLWSWYEGEWVRDASGVLVRVRDDWRLWTSLGLLGWSFLGRVVMVPLLAKSDTRRSKAERGEGRVISSPTGSSLYVESHGPAGAPPIVFTHGWGMDSTFWHYAKQDLGQRFRLTLWDLPGLDTTYTNPLKTMIFSGLLRALQRPVLEPLMRVMIVLQPLVWLSSWQSYLSGSAHLAHRLGFGKFVTRSQLEHSTLLATRNSPAVQMKGNIAMFHWDATGALSGLGIPALVIGGDKDIVTKLEASRTIADESKRCRLEVVEGVNHMGPMERADVYNGLIADFASSAQPAAV